MLVGVADTHTVIWYLHASARLSPTARTFIDAAAAIGDQIGLSSITLIEMVYLIEKGRIAVESFTRLASVLEEHGALFVELPLTLRVARALAGIDASTVPDMPDRIIAATALYHQIPVISADSKDPAVTRCHHLVTMLSLGLDHPMLLRAPQTRYLICVIAEVS